MKRIIYILIACTLTITCSGCAPAYAVLDQFVGNDTIALEESSSRVGFSNGVVTDTTNIMSTDAFNQLPITYDDYHSGNLYQQLSEPSEQLIYRAFEYAMENSFQNILFSADLVEDTDQLQRILTFLSLDSPLLEQNLSYEIGSFTTYYPVEIFDGYNKEACFEGYYLSVNNFQTDLWEKKLEAIDKANQILTELNLDDYIDERAKAACIYRYIGNTVSYEEYEYPENNNVYPYLYDTLVRGRSHCDGFTNAISLLLNMADIYCVEKQCSTLDSSNVGHTWNFACLDNRWYNIDGTYVDWIPIIDSSAGAGPGFGFSDMFERGSPDYNEYYTESIHNCSMEPDAQLSSANESDFVNIVVNAFHLHDNQWSYIILDSYNKDTLNQQMQLVANDLHSRVYYASFPIMEQRSAIFIYNGNLYNK